MFDVVLSDFSASLEHVNLVECLHDDKVGKIIHAVDSLTKQVDKYQNQYTLDKRTIRAVPIFNNHYSYRKGAAS